MKKNRFIIDNAGKIFAQVSNAGSPNTFRISVELADTIDPDILKQATNDILPRFPTFKTKITTHFFWQYLSDNDKVAEVYPLEPNMRAYFNPKENNLFMFRVSFRDNTITVDVHHSLSDGYGGMIFLQSLVYRYLELSGVDVKPCKDIKTLDQSATQEELEDSYTTHYTRKNDKAAAAGHAYRFKVEGDIVDPGICTRTVKWDSGAILKLAREHNSTITEYLTAVYAYSIYKTYLEGREDTTVLPVMICIPYDLRRLFQSQTLKNFSTYIKTKYHFEKDSTFEMVLEEIKKQVKEENDKDFLAARTNSTVKLERWFINRWAPFFIKRPIMKYVYNRMSDKAITASFSNLGVAQFPESIAEHIKGCEINFFAAGISICAITHNGILRMTFNKNFTDEGIEQQFIQHLAEQGIQPL